MNQLVSELRLGKNNLDPVAGEMRVMDGRLAMCVNPFASYGGKSGPIWAIEGVSFKFTATGRRDRYVDGVCEKVDPIAQTVTFLMIQPKTHPAQLSGEVLTFHISEIGRLEPEYPNWKISYWKEQQRVQYTESILESVGFNMDDAVKNRHTGSWKKLVGDVTYGQLIDLLETTREVANIIDSAQGNCTLMPSPRLKQLTQHISIQLSSTSPKMNTSIELSRSQQGAYGAVLGALVGDAAGGVLEFLGRDPTPYECEEALCMPGGGVFDLAPGQFTDDGEMTVSLLRALALAEGKFDQRVIASTYCNWERSSPFDIGNATSGALRISPHEYDGQRVAELIMAQAMEYNSDSKANGSLMRATPLGILAAGLTPEETIEMACLDARLTHPNPTCQAATVAYVLAIRHLIQQPGDHRGAFKAAKTHVQSLSPEVAEWLDDACEGNMPAAYPMMGFVRYGFTYAFHYLYNATNYKTAILETLARGGDTDTNACIVGGLLGALHGMDKLPQDALNKVLSCDTNFGQFRPEAYTIKPVMRHLKKLCHYSLGE